MDLTALFEAREEAVAAYEAFVTPFVESRTALTDEDNAKRSELKAAATLIDERIVELDASARKDAEIAEARKRLFPDAIDVEVTETTKPEGRSGDDGSHIDVKVVSEPRTYGEGSPNSYFADLVRASSFSWKGNEGAVERLNRHAREVAVEVRDNTDEGKRARAQVRDAYRSENGAEARDALTGLEARAGMDTTGSSGGSFATPVYQVADYAPYRQFGRVFTDQANKQSLPDYGMTIYLPALSAPAGVAAQVGQNQGVTENDPTAGYISANLSTLAGEVTVSQQLLDRAGPNFQFDKMVFDQLQRAYDLQVDTFVLTQALANSASITTTNSGPAFSGATGSLVQKIAQAKSQLASTAGTVLPATHVFAQPSRFESYTANAIDTQGRPVLVPQYGGPFNAFGAGTDGKQNNPPEGDTGYRVLGLPVFEDANIPTPAAGTDQVIVAHMPEVWVFEGALVPRVIPQTYAQNLSVLLQAYAYIAVIVRYPKAVQAISGSGFTSPVF